MTAHARLALAALASLAAPGPTRDVLRELKAASARNLLFLPVRLGAGAEHRFVLDTGASATIVDSRVAAAERLRPGATIDSQGAGADRCPIAELDAKGRSGRTTLSPVYAADLSALGNFVATPIAGIAGGDLFSHNVVALDFAGRRATLLPASYARGPRDMVIPLLPPRGVCCTAVGTLHVQSKTLRGRFLIDTGAPAFEVVLAAPFAKQNGLLPSDRTGALQVPGLCSMSVLVPLPGAATLRLGDVAADRVAVFASFDAEGALASGDFDGVIGGALLRRLGEVFVDVPHRRLVVRPH